MNIDKINEVLNNIGNKKTLVWGAGEHTEKLFENTTLKTLKSLIICDKEKNGEIYNHDIQRFSNINWNDIEIIIISSFTYQNEIEKEIKNISNFKGDIVKLYIDSDKEPFYLEKTFYEKIQNAYLDRINQFRKDRKKIKVMFWVTQNSLWNCQSLYNELDNNKVFEVQILALPNHEDSINNFSVSCLENYNFFIKRNMNVVMGYEIESKKFIDLLNLDCDIIFLDQPYNIFEKEYPYEKLAKKYFICYVPYGYKVAYAPQAHFNMKLQNVAWKIFCESEWHYSQFVKYEKLKGENVAVSGYPKLDEYSNGNMDYSVWKNGNSKKKRIIWAPHWAFRCNNLQVSTFDKNYKKFYKYASKHQEIDWILKPHQRLFFWAIESGLMNRKEVKEYIKCWNDLPNAKVYNEGMYMNIFKTSDALITDCGSFLGEYLPNNKPVIQLYNAGLKLNEIGNKIVKSYYIAHNFEEVEKYIKNIVIENDDYKKNDRENVMKFVMPNRNGAGKKIVNYLYDTFYKK